MDPLTAKLAGDFASGLGSSLGGGPVGPSEAILRGENMFDSSGWNVNFGAGKIDSNREQAGEFSQYVPYVLAAAAVLIAWRMSRKK